MTIGFTGTRKGMSAAQAQAKRAVRYARAEGRPVVLLSRGNARRSA